jgi:hypothetical protein
MRPDTITVDTGNLRAGMIVVDTEKKETTGLKELLPGTKGCNGLHFKTPRNQNVCYLPGGRVEVKNG